MGIYDRDYMREGYVPGNQRGKKPPNRRSWITFPLMVLTLVLVGIGSIFLMSLQENADDSGFITDSDPQEVVRPEYPLDLNTATFDDLLTVPHIGPATAEQIINNRPFEKLDDLLDLHGVGESKLKVFSQYLTIASPVSEASTEVAPE